MLCVHADVVYCRIVYYDIIHLGIMASARYIIDHDRSLVYRILCDGCMTSIDSEGIDGGIGFFGVEKRLKTFAFFIYSYINGSGCCRLSTDIDDICSSGDMFCEGVVGVAFGIHSIGEGLWRDVEDADDFRFIHEKDVLLI